MRQQWLRPPKMLRVGTIPNVHEGYLKASLKPEQANLKFVGAQPERFAPDLFNCWGIRAGQRRRGRGGCLKFGLPDNVHFVEQDILC